MSGTGAQVGEVAPSFSLEADDGSRFESADLRGARALLVFYPGDNTPVCTRQLRDYRDGAADFAGLGVRIIGISKDGRASHAAFRSRHELPFTLLSDPDLAVAGRFGVRGALGMKRAVFLLDEEGVVRYAKVEALPVFRRRREELLQAIRKLDEG
ncbi:MAG: peroxiredoxin [Gammaproteobacteria bacterium]